MQELVKPALFNAQLIRSLGCATYQGSEVGECLAIANQIEPGNKESWYARWTAFADSNFSMAETCRSQGFHFDAKLAFLRACTYYRTAFFSWKMNLLIQGSNKHCNTAFELFTKHSNFLKLLWKK